MENTETTTPQKNKNTPIIILGALLIGSIGGNAYLYNQKVKVEKEIVYVTDAKAGMKLELDKLSAELEEAISSNDKLSGENKALNEEKIAQIAKLQSSLKKGNLSAKQLEDARNEIDQLKYYVKKYQTQIAELQTENKKLNDENSGLKTTVETEKGKNNKLTDENVTLGNKVAVAQMLKTQFISAKPVRARSKGREEEVDRARQMEKLHVSFSVVDNPVANTGERTFYLRVINPANKLEVITDESDSKFKAEGEDLQYTAKLSAPFNNDKQVYNIFWKKASNYDKGTYQVLLYADGFVMGKGTFTLK